MDTRTQLRNRLGRPPLSTAYEGFYLSGNPFPPSGIEAVFPMVNQQDANQQIIEALANFFQQSGGQQQASRLLITSDHRGGKTHFLKHYLRNLQELERAGELVGLRALYINNPDVSMERLISRVLTELGGIEFLGDFVLQAGDRISDDPSVREFREAVRSLQGLLQQIQVSERGEEGQLENASEAQYKLQVLLKWLSGHGCTEREKKEIKVVSNLESSTEVIGHFAHMVRAGTDAGLFSFLLIAVDEAETIVSASLTQRQKERYLLDLRHFLDTVPGTVMLIMAALSYILQDLRSYPAILNRLKPEIPLKLIEPGEAKIWAARYLIDVRQKWLGTHHNQEEELCRQGLLVPGDVPDNQLPDSALSPLTVSDVQQAFDNIKLRNNMARPGDLLGELNRLLAEKVTAAAR